MREKIILEYLLRWLTRLRGWHREVVGRLVRGFAATTIPLKTID